MKNPLEVEHSARHPAPRGAPFPPDAAVGVPFGLVLQRPLKLQALHLSLHTEMMT
jgi:hypothetical protein